MWRHWLHFIGQQNLDIVGSFAGFLHANHGHAGGDGAFIVYRAFPLGHNYIQTAFFQVLGLGMALAAIAKNRDFFAFQKRQVCIIVIIHFSHIPYLRFMFTNKYK